jgi:hypothetical protein
MLPTLGLTLVTLSATVSTWLDSTAQPSLPSSSSR